MTKTLLYALERSHTPSEAKGETERLIRSVLPDSDGSLLALIERPVAELPPGESTRERVLAAGLLLARGGAPGVFPRLLTLSHRLHEFERAGQLPDPRAGLLKGVAEIGLGWSAQGIRNLLTFLDRRGERGVESTIALWALCSVSVARRDARLALEFAERWRSSAAASELPGEEAQAGLAVAILTFVLGDGARPSPDSGSAPLFLGLGPLSHGAFGSLEAADLVALHGLRASFDLPGKRATLSLEDLERLAHTYAAWGLSGPLDEIEQEVRTRSPEAFFRSRLSRLVGREILEGMVDAPASVQDLADVVVWIADVRSFTVLCERLEPRRIFDLLSPVFRILNEEIEAAGGLILEFIGDSILCVFHAFPGQPLDPAAILNRSARALLRLHVELALRKRAGDPNLRLGIGIQRGPVAIGNLGGLRRCHLTALGDVVNQAARIEGKTREFPGPIAVGAAFFGGRPPDVWREPLQVRSSIRDMGEQPLRGVTDLTRLYSVSPLLQYWVDFVPMGYIDVPARGVVYVDTGGRRAPGVLDHHFEGTRASCSCHLLLDEPGLLLEHVRGVPSSEIEFRLHEKPDLDCAATLYAAYEILGEQPRLERLRALADYVGRIDQGRLPGVDTLSDSLYGVFLAHQYVVMDEKKMRASDRDLLEAGLRVIDAAIHLLDRGVDRDLTDIFGASPGWFVRERELLGADRLEYRADRARGLTYAARVRGLATPAIGLWLDHPRSILFKLWARNDPEAPGGVGFPFLAVDWSEPGRNRFVLSVDPESGTDLDGLGGALEAAEAERRRALGLARPVEPRRWPADNADPWYFGQGHRYTILDAPSRGSVLSAEEVRAVHQSWLPPS